MATAVVSLPPRPSVVTSRLYETPWYPAITTIRPREISSWTRNGRTSIMRASMWRSLVMMPDWLPVKLIASPPSSRIAIDSSAIEIRSPADSSMSSSRRSGFAETRLARASSSSVVSPIADTTTTTSLPARRVCMTRSATLRMRSTSATLLPPYFWTTIGTVVQGASGCCKVLQGAGCCRVRRGAAYVSTYLYLSHARHGEAASVRKTKSFGALVRYVGHQTEMHLAAPSTLTHPAAP